MTARRKVSVDSSLLVPIVGDGAMAGPVADGRLLPVLILDTSSRPKLAELIRVHRHLPPGDATSQWASSRENTDYVFLLLTFERPMDLEVVLQFSIEREAILVETLLRGGGVYLQSGDLGDRVTTSMGQPRILVEVPDTGFRPVWDDLLLDRMTVVMSRRLGIPKRKARDHASAVIAKMQELAQLRMGT